MTKVAVRNRSTTLATLLHPARAFLFLLVVAVRLAGSATLAWDPVSSPALSGYMVYYGPAGRQLHFENRRRQHDAAYGGQSHRWRATYHFAVTAYDASHTESAFSNDASTTLPSGAPVAGFTASATSGVAPLAMNFTNTSTGSITTYAWSFGDGTSSTVQSPSHVYSAAGVFTVSLTVTGSGGSNTKTMPNYVTVTAAPLRHLAARPRLPRLRPAPAGARAST